MLADLEAAGRGPPVVRLRTAGIKKSEKMPTVLFLDHYIKHAVLELQHARKGQVGPLGFCIIRQFQKQTSSANLLSSVPPQVLFFPEHFITRNITG